MDQSTHWVGILDDLGEQSGDRRELVCVWDPIVDVDGERGTTRVWTWDGLSL